MEKRGYGKLLFENGNTEGRPVSVLLHDRHEMKLADHESIKPGEPLEFSLTENNFDWISNVLGDEDGEKLVAMETVLSVLDQGLFHGVLYANAPCVFRSNDRVCLAYFRAQDASFRRVQNPFDRKYSVSGDYKPINQNQAFYWAFMKNPFIKGIMVDGEAGSGKTSLAISFGMTHLKKEKFDIRIIRPTRERGESQGFRKGYLHEKIGPFAVSTRKLFEKVKGENDDFEFIVTEEITYSKDAAMSANGNGSNGNGSKKKRRLIIDVVNYCLGSTYDKEFIAIDDAQEFEKEDIKLLLTRSGEDAKYVIAGDASLYQRTKAGNGLDYYMRAMVNHPLTACIKLPVCERSYLASLTIARTKDLDENLAIERDRERKRKNKNR